MYEIKSKTVAYLLWLFLGIFGVHRFYTRNYLIGILMLLTLGGGGVWWFIDLFFIGKRINKINGVVHNRTLEPLDIKSSNFYPSTQLSNENNSRFLIDFVSFRAEQSTLKKVYVEFVDDYQKIYIDSKEHYFDAYYVENEGLSSDRKYYRIATPEYKFWVNPKDLKGFMKLAKIRQLDLIDSRIDRHKSILKQIDVPFEFDEIDQDIYHCFINNKSGMTEEVGTHQQLIKTEEKIKEICEVNGGRYFKSKAKSAKFAIIFSPYSRTYSNYKSLKDKGYKVTTFEKAIKYFKLTEMWDCDKLSKLAKENLDYNINHSKKALEKLIQKRNSID
ncbi:TM2 domain-containing protein [Pseudoneobacillus sp. C159]